MKLLAPRDAGRMLGVTSERVRQLARAKSLREIRDSMGRRLFRESDVLRLKAIREERRGTRGEPVNTVVAR